jgi:preprotein translocase SecE subunit
MYKWPQGRVIRTICLLLTLIVVADLGYNGAYGPFSFYLTNGAGAEGATRQFGIGLFFSALALAAFGAGLVFVGFHQRAVEFLIEVEQEMVRVEWPTMPVLIRSTLIIAVAIVVMAVLILGVDFVNFYFLELVRWLGGKL